MNNDYKDYLQKVIRDSAPNIKASEILCILFTKNYMEEPYCLLQMGIAIIEDKPIYLLVQEDMILPENVKRLARKIEYYKSADDIRLASRRLFEKK